MVVAQPTAGTIVDRRGVACPAAVPSSYPLSAVCTCGQPIICVDGTAVWFHYGASASCSSIITCDRCGRATTDPDRWDPDAKTGRVLCDPCWDVEHRVTS